MNNKYKLNRLVIERNAFTLIELLVVVAIIVILAAVTIPAIKSLTKSNGVAQSQNLVRSYLSNARAIAISQRKMVGVVFFEETAANTSPILPYHAGQTAMQLIIEAPEQTDTSYYDTASGNTVTGKASDNTVFVYYSKERQYFPSGMQIATLNDDPTKQVLTANNTGAIIPRVILFDSLGQMILRNSLARPLLTGGTGDGGYPKAYGDWGLIPQGTNNPPGGVSSPGILIYSGNDFKEFLASGSPTNATIGNWMQQHADIIIVNAYTGGIIR